MLNIQNYIIFILAFFFAVQAFAKVPEVRTETREENGKKINYMFIDGVKVHETNPAKVSFPPVVEPKPYDPQWGKPPKGAIVLFDGTESSMSNWTAMNGSPTKWTFEDGALVAVPRSGYIRSKQDFGSCRLYLEFATPAPSKGTGQASGNSGVFLMGKYEIQVLNSFGEMPIPLIPMVSVVHFTAGPSLWSMPPGLLASGRLTILLLPVHFLMSRARLLDGLSSA